MKYFIDYEVWYQGKKQQPRKVELISVIPRDKETAFCYDKDGDEYILPLSEIIDTAHPTEKGGANDDKK